MIREANRDDMPALLQMGRKFFDACSFPAEMVFDEGVLEGTIINLFDNEKAVILVDDALRGVIGGIVYPYYFTGQIAGNEMFWWVEPEHRGHLGTPLLDALEDWAKEQGAISFSMIAMENSSPDKMARIYEGRGYFPLEHHYTRIF